MTTIETDLRKIQRTLPEDLTPADALAMYRYMVLTRAICERWWLLQRGGKTPFVVTAEGHEGAQIGAAFAMDRERDYFVPYYRDAGIVLVAGMTPRELMLNTLAKAPGRRRGASAARGKPRRF